MSSVRVCFLLVGAVIFAQTPARGMTYNLTFDSQSKIVSQPVGSLPPDVWATETIINAASFSPFTLYDGDKLSITFTGTTYPAFFPQFNPATNVMVNLYGTGADEAIIAETLKIDGLVASTASLENDGSKFTFHQSVPGLYFSPTWTSIFVLSSGAPSNSEGLTVDRVEIFATLVPEPSTWLMMLLGFLAIGALTYRSTGTCSTIAAQVVLATGATRGK